MSPGRACNYSATQNNGRIVSSADAVTGENVSYAYDSLNRLIAAANTKGQTDLMVTDGTFPRTLRFLPGHGVHGTWLLAYDVRDRCTLIFRRTAPDLRLLFHQEPGDGRRKGA